MAPGAAVVGKYNPNHDERGRFSTGDGGGQAPSAARGKPSAGVQIAEIDRQFANPGVMSDASPTPAAPDVNTPNPDSYSGPGGTLEYVDAPSGPSPASPGPASLGWEIAQRLVTTAIETLGSDAATTLFAASALASAILVASTKSTGDPNVGVVPGRPEVSFEWNPTTGKIQFFLTDQDGRKGRTLIIQGQQGKLPGVLLDAEQRLLALEGKDSNGYVLANIGLLDEAVAAVRSPGELPGASRESGGDLQVYYNPDTKEVRIASVGANSDGTLPPGFIAAWKISQGLPIDPAQDGANDSLLGAPNRSRRLVDPNLINRLVASGAKITPEHVVATGTMPDGRIVWLESGD